MKKPNERKPKPRSIYKVAYRLIRMQRDPRAWCGPVVDMIQKLEHAKGYHNSRINLIRHAKMCIVEGKKNNIDNKGEVMEILRDYLANG